MSKLMSEEVLRLRRHRAEKRFIWYGRLGLGVAGLAIVILLFTIISRALPGFVQTEIALDVTFTEQMIDPDGEGEIVWPKANYTKLVRQSLLARFDGVTQRREKKQLYAFLSSAASFEVRDMLLDNPSLMGETVRVWVTASDLIDRYQKGYLKEQGQLDKLSKQQFAWLDLLEEEGALASHIDWSFLHDGDSREPEQAGFLSSMAGSMLTLFICWLVAFPLGVLTAVFLEEFARKNNPLVDVIEVNINNLAAVPSIVFGLLGLAVYINLFGMPRSAPVVGGLTLALMTLPVIIISTRVSLKAVPDSIRQAARGMGASELQVVLHHVLPLAMPGIMTGTILGLARAIGETAPLLMIGMVAFVADIPQGFFDPATAMPVQIFLWASSPELSFVEKTAAGIMVLLIILIAMNALAIYIRKRFETRW